MNRSKLFILPLLILSSLSACKRDYVCKCESGNTPVYEIKGKTKRAAKAECLSHTPVCPTDQACIEL